MLARHAHMFKTHPKLDWDAIYGNPNQSLFEFDSLVTAPLGGFVRPSSPYFLSSQLTFSWLAGYRRRILPRRLRL
jgi:hypothetical protein